MEKGKSDFVRNKYGVIVMIYCASCVHKVMCRSMFKRRCRLTGKDVAPLDVCKNWEISNLLRNVGRSKGVVRDKDTKEIVIS